METIKNFLNTNKLLNDKVRLAIMATLSTGDEALEFNHLLEKLELTKGNLSSHMRKLEEAGLVEIKKEFVGKKPKTTYLCTEEGKKECKEYLSALESLITSKE